MIAEYFLVNSCTLVNIRSLEYLRRLLEILQKTSHA